MPEVATASARILVVDDDETLLDLTAQVLSEDGHEVARATSAEDALGALERGDFSLVLADLRLPGMSGLELLGELRRSATDVPLILLTGHGSISTAVEAMRGGALDYVTKPVSPEDLQLKVRRALRERRLEVENRWLRAEVADSHRPGRIVAVSPAMRELVATAEKLASSDASVLLFGESGTGKELFAQALHYGGPRAGGPFVAVNCAAIPSGLVESELFGHARGAFTGATRDHAGKMEVADQGTLFLDEVGELPLETQPKLLRVLEERTFTRVGDSRQRSVDARFVAATNRDLRQRVEEGKFREDLYYRLAVIPLALPPLRERPEDIPPLVHYFLRHLAGDDVPEISEEALASLCRRRWPGNGRELRNTLERALALHGDGPLTLADFPEGNPVASRAPSAVPSAAGDSYLVSLPSGGAPLDEMVRDLILQALESKGWNQSAAARLLRIPRHVLQYRMQKFGLVPPDRGPAS